MSEPGDNHRRFKEWALKNGITLKKVRPAYFEGAGMGMVAMEKISVCSLPLHTIMQICI